MRSYLITCTLFALFIASPWLALGLGHLYRWDRRRADIARRNKVQRHNYRVWE